MVAKITDVELEKLMEQARKLPPMNPAEQRGQAISFVYGSLRLHNPNITREMVEQAYDRLHPKQ